MVDHGEINNYSVLCENNSFVYTSDMSTGFTESRRQPQKVHLVIDSIRKINFVSESDFLLLIVSRLFLRRLKYLNQHIIISTLISKMFYLFNYDALKHQKENCSCSKRGWCNLFILRDLCFRRRSTQSKITYQTTSFTT